MMHMAKVSGKIKREGIVDNYFIQHSLNDHTTAIHWV